MIINIYVAGLISTERPASIIWREQAEAWWEAGNRARVLSPLSRKRQLALHSKDGGITDPRLEPADIILRDYQDVMRSDLVLANLNLWGSPRPMLGTWPELGWAWEHKKPIIAISTPGDSNYNLSRTHPFVRAFVAHYFDTPADAFEFIDTYYAR